MTLIETIQNWLQGEINTCVAGHSARLDRLEESRCADKTVTELLNRMNELEEKLDRRMTALEKSLTKDLEYEVEQAVGRVLDSSSITLTLT